MEDSKQKITGILLAGGLSKRMGREKGVMKIGNRKLFEYPLRILEILCDEILISTCKDSSPAMSYPAICDEKRGIGPMGGIHACLKRSSSELNIVLSYDMPLVNEGLLRFLIQESPGYEMVVPALQKERPEPLCGIYRKSVVEIFSELIEEKSYAVHRAISQTRSRVVIIEPAMPFYRDNLFLNINRVEDLEELPVGFGNEW